jgi:hypothetical protein
MHAPCRVSHQLTGTTVNAESLNRDRNELDKSPHRSAYGCSRRPRRRGKTGGKSAYSPEIEHRRRLLTRPSPPLYIARPADALCRVPSEARSAKEGCLHARDFPHSSLAKFG